MKKKGKGYKLNKASRNALRNLVKDLNKATKNLINAGVDLSVLLVPRSAAKIHKHMGKLAARVDRISNAYSRLR